MGILRTTGRRTPFSHWGRGQGEGEAMRRRLENQKAAPKDGLLCTGAGEAIRTPDPNLGKVMLYP
jgi:hypothetical protein